MIAKIPFSAVQTALYSTLSMKDASNNKIIGMDTFDSSTPVNEVEAYFKGAAEIAYAIYGNTNIDIDTNTKSEYIWTVRENIEIYSNYNGRKVVSEKLQAVVNHLSSDAGFNKLCECLQTAGYLVGSLGIENISVNQTVFTEAQNWNTGSLTVVLILRQK